MTKRLNGNLYFEKEDVADIRKQTIFYLNHPDEVHDYLYLVSEDERTIIIQGIDALHNTLSWEFSSETALNLDTINRCYNSLRIHSTTMMDISEFRKIPETQLTSYCFSKLENWLKSKGHQLFYSFFEDYSDN